jgi:hypothetical protein
MLAQEQVKGSLATVKAPPFVLCHQYFDPGIIHVVAGSAGPHKGPLRWAQVDFRQMPLLLPYLCPKDERSKYPRRLRAGLLRVDR